MLSKWVSRLACSSLLLGLAPACVDVDEEVDGPADPGSGALAEDAPGEEVGASADELSRSGYTWVLGYRGGGGGGPAAAGCGGGDVAVGIFGRSGAYIDQLGLLCARLNQDGGLGPAYTTWAMGGGGGAPFHAICPSGQALVGLDGRSGRFVDQLGIRCAPAGAWGSNGIVWSARYAGGGNGGNFFSDTCPQGYVITRIDGRSGQFVDGEQATCEYLWP
jgi:hypothetical protein